MKARYRRFRDILEVLVLVGLLGLATSASAAQAASVEPLTCGHTRMVRDFLKPLERMAPIHEPPISGKLPFAPRGMNLKARGIGLIVGGGLVGFALSDDAIEQIRHLDWIVETELARVDRRGEVVSRLGAKRRVLGSIEGNSIEDILHRVSGKPAFYRLDISFFRRGTHQLLGKYSTYSRVMRPRVDFRVVIETPTVVPGELATAKLINLGNVPIEGYSYDFGFNVQAFTGARWVYVPENPPRGHTRKRVQILPAGTENRGCLRYLVPTGQAPGLFRFVAQGAQGEVLLAAEFEVGAAP